MFKRIGSVVILMIATAWLSGSPAWNSLMAFAVALVGYITIEAVQHHESAKKSEAGGDVASKSKGHVNDEQLKQGQNANEEGSARRRSLCTSDLELIEKMENQFGPQTYSFLREQDMGASFPYEYIRPIFEYTDTWKGPHFEFVDPELEEIRMRFRAAMVAFSHKVAIYTTSDGRFVSMGMRDWEDRPEVLKWRDELDQEGHDVADLLEEFVKVARKKKAESEK